MKQKSCKITAMLLSFGLIATTNTSFARVQSLNIKTAPVMPTVVSSNVAQNAKTFQDIFPDIAFAKVVASELGKVSTDTVTQTELHQITQLDVSLHRNSQEISSIKGVGQLSNLEYLSLNFNKLTELPAEIGQLSNLSWFSLAFNELTE